LWVNLQPFIGALFAVLILSEDLVAIQIAGGVVIAISIAIARTRHQPITPRID
jgi:drug/metabolite transporter (DMT)-like permease